MNAIGAGDKIAATEGNLLTDIEPEFLGKGVCIVSYDLICGGVDCVIFYADTYRR